MSLLRFCAASWFGAAALVTASGAQAGTLKPITTVPASDDIWPLGSASSKFVYTQAKGGAPAQDEVHATDGTADVVLVTTARGFPS